MDFDCWAWLEELTDQKISFDEYCEISKREDEILEIDKNDSKKINILKSMMKEIKLTNLGFSDGKIF